MKIAKVCFIAMALGAIQINAGQDLDSIPSIDVGERPESIVRGFDGDLFVTVMNGQEDGDGVVKRIRNGKVSVFATGLNEPKGICFVGGYLITTDLTRVVKIDARGNVEVLAAKEDFPVEPWYLNDAAAAPDGMGVYITDMGDRGKMFSEPRVFWPLDSKEADMIELVGKVFHISLEGDVTVTISPSKLMKNPNGVGVGKDGQLLVGGFFTGNFLEQHEDQLHIVKSGFRGADAVEQDSYGNYYTSSWVQGKVWKISPKGKVKVLLKGLQSAADFYFNQSEGKIYVPDMLAGKVYIIEL